MKTKSAFIIVLAFMASACAGINCTTGDTKTTGSYGYHPLDPIPVKVEKKGDKEITNQKILNSLPDETMRMAIGEVQASGGITYGPAKAVYSASNYVVVLDYIKSTTNSLPVAVVKSPDNKLKSVSIASTATNIVPVYIGVGLRLTANVTVNEGSIDLGSLYALGAAAQAKQISGTLTVQTLGITGKNISPLIPMPGELSSSTIQSAILAMGTIKAKIHDDETNITPRVVGIYNNLEGGEETINRFISSLLNTPQKIIVDATK